MTSGWVPNNSIHDIDGKIGPPPVDPMAVVAWYPTRYDARALFGKRHAGVTKNLDGSNKEFAVMAVFGGDDELPGATKDDADELKKRLQQDSRVRDLMVKIFPKQGHGFAHNHLGKDPAEEDDKSELELTIDQEFGGSGRVSFGTGDADIAFLLSTAWMETYSRVFLPTIGKKVRGDKQETTTGKSRSGGGASSAYTEKWSELMMPDLTETHTRDIREEIDDALNSYSPPKNTFDDLTEEEEEERTKRILMSYQDGKDAGIYTINKDDSIEDMVEKLKAWDKNLELF